MMEPDVLIVYNGGPTKPEYYSGFSLKNGPMWVWDIKDAMVMKLREAQIMVNNYNKSKNTTAYTWILLNCSIGNVDKTDPTKAYDRAMRGI